MNCIEIDYSNVSCGVRQLSGVHETSLEAFKLIVAEKDGAVGGEDQHFRKGYTYVFSDNSWGNGKKIAALIRRAGLGKVTAFGWSHNPNSGHSINTWVWKYNGTVPASWKKLKGPDDGTAYTVWL